MSDSPFAISPPPAGAAVPAVAGVGAKARAICVLGMHRSGTSALAGLLHLLGVELGEKLVAPRPDNPKGFWEHEMIVRYHLGLLETLGSCQEDFFPLPEGWLQRPDVAPFYHEMLQILRRDFAGKPLWGIKDPRACRLMPLWHTLFAAFPVQANYILAVRDPGEIADSMLVRTGYPYNQSLLMALGHMLEAERQTRGHKREIVTYNQLLSDWPAQAKRIGTTLGISWPRSPQAVEIQAAQFLDSNLRHHQVENAAIAEQRAVACRGADPHIARWAFGVYTLLSTAAVTGWVDHQALDRIGGEFFRASHVLRAWRPGKWSSQKPTGSL